MRFTAAGLSRRARLGILLTAVLAAGSGTAIFTATAANAATGCSVSYTITNQWPGGFGAAVNITNLGDPITSWTLKWSFANGQTVTQLWNGSVSQSGANVTVTNLSYNGSIGTGATLTGMGFNGSWNNSTNSVPTSFSLNGTNCTGGVTGGPSPSASRTTSPTSSPSRTTSPTSSPSRTASPTPTQVNCTNCPHVDNAYAGAKMYINSDWSARANAEPGGSRIANQPTGVWLDSMAAITAPAGSGYTTSLAGHLDRALSQGATAAQFVIYDLPGRDCAALASNGEIPTDGLDTYEHSYIDPIASIIGNTKYSGIRIILIIEIDSLPNLVTNVSGNTASSTCATMQQNGGYVKGIQYALSKFHAIPNVYNYIDAAHSGWLGWDSNFGPAISLFASTAQGATGGFATVDGFITDTANYTPTTEPFINPTQQVGSGQEMSANFYQFNPFPAELPYAQSFYTRAVAAGFSPNIGMLIDTSRNGWGGINRPTAASTSTDLNTFVDQSRVDKRPSRGDWCNQNGAGLGERPRANPATNIDAYVWIKPPGESDGSSSLIPTGPDNPGGKGFDQMCDPTYGGNVRNNNSATNALPNSPVSGAWFSAQFQQLMQNAFPAL